MREAYRSDLEVHRSDAGKLPPQNSEILCRFLIERENCELRHSFETALQLKVAIDLIVPGPVTIQQSQPAPDCFLGCRNADKYVRTALIDSPQEPAAARAYLDEFPEMVRVKDH